MTRTKKYLIAVFLASAVFALSACNTMIHYHRTVAPPAAEKHVGPPPHAPAHGYRHKHSDGMQLVYESSMDVYIVVGYSNHYYYHSNYYRWNKNAWQVSSKISRGWARASEKAIPPGLRRTHVCKKGK